MKELVVISGKGGTGKTSLVASFAALIEKSVIVDCDVDAADLHLILDPTIQERKNFYGGFTAAIQKDKCTECGKCIEVCRFEAVLEDFAIDEISCEGCCICAHFCPDDAINLIKNITGEWYISDTRFGIFVHALLGIGEENSGKLVTQVKKAAKEIAEKEKISTIIVDGSPGIGCTVIASLSGADYVLIVTEPTLSGVHDLNRVAQLVKHFKIDAGVCINKYDLNIEIAEDIEKYSIENKMDFIGNIPYDEVFINAITEGKSVIEYSNGIVSGIIKDIWKRLTEELENL